MEDSGEKMLNYELFSSAFFCTISCATDGLPKSKGLNFLLDVVSDSCFHVFLLVRNSQYDNIPLIFRSYRL